MRLGQVSVKPRTDVHDTCVDIEGVTVWMPYGWFARLLLKEVSGPEFSKLEKLIQRRDNIFSFVPGYEQYDYQREVARIEVYGNSIGDFVRRGAFHNPQIMFELGHELYQNLEAMIRAM